MDYFAHAAWSLILFQKSKKVWYAVLFGILPDTCSWLIYLLYRIMSGSSFGRQELVNLPSWMPTLYGISHSLIICLVIIVVTFLIFYLLQKQLPYVMLAWPLHIFIDIPTHSRDFLPTPFLWPLSDYAFPGMSWSTPWFWILTWIAIIFTITILFVRKKSIAQKRAHTA